MKIICTKREKETLLSTLKNPGSCPFTGTHQGAGCSGRDCGECFEQEVEWDVSGKAHETLFTVIDKKTGEYPDVRSIARRCKWAKGLIYCDIDGFALTEEGKLILTDDCGNVAYCPDDRFEVVFYEPLAEEYGKP